MQMYWFSELVRAFGMSTSLILELPQIAKEKCAYVVNDGDIYVFAEINGKSEPLFRADNVKQLPSLFRKVLMGVCLSEYEAFSAQAPFILPKEQRIING